ncbi:hypothetical protein [Stutzerimonas nitrititolerans]|uniref:hypothetical protein n=1 Tax=Stutzerimonas nitrititolerans TaxID=2482751 RepID=UPI00289C5E3B|nr:hypothetical protein [Stutzerimonas nitrititolerans]
MSDELKPCPFCGSEAGLSKGGRALCSNEDCIACDLFAPVEDWNRRAQPAEAEGARDYLTEFAEGEVEAKTAIEELQDALSAVTAERDAALAENARLIEDRARFPDRPDDIGHMIGSHIGNLKAGKEQAEKYARKWRDNLDSELRAVDQLRAEIEALRPDAELYRRLRDLPDDQVGTAGVPCVAVPRGPFSGTYVSGAELDAAMAAKEA